MSRNIPTNFTFMSEIGYVMNLNYNFNLSLCDQAKAAWIINLMKQK